MRCTHACLLSSLALACAPACAASSLATSELLLIDEAAKDLQPKPGSGLEFACHMDPIIWLDLAVDRDAWMLTSVDERGRVGRWTRRGLEQTWTLAADEFSHVIMTSKRLEVMEDTPALRERAKTPKLLDACRNRRCMTHPGFGDLAPRDAHRWLAVDSGERGRTRHFDEDTEFVGVGRRLAAEGRWFAVGDQRGNLAVASVSNGDYEKMWRAPACEVGRLSATFGTLDPSETGTQPRPRYSYDLVTISRLAHGRILVRHVDLAAGTHAILIALAPGDGFGAPAFNASTGQLLMPWTAQTDHGSWPALRRLDLADRGGPPRQLESMYGVHTISYGHSWVIVSTSSGAALVPMTELGQARPTLLERTARLEISANDRWLASLVDSARLVRELPDGVPHDVRATLPDADSRVAVSNDGTMAVSFGGEHPRVELLDLDGELRVPELPAGVETMKFVSTSMESDDILWMRLWNHELWRIIDGGEPEVHVITGGEEVIRIIGRGPGTSPTLAFVDDHGVGIQRLDDGAVLRVTVHDPHAMAIPRHGSTPHRRGAMALLWVDAASRRRCRHDDPSFDHVDRSEPRVSDVGGLVSAFVTGKSCPSDE